MNDDRRTLLIATLFMFAGIFLLASLFFGAEVTVQLSPGPVLLTSPPTISPDSQRAVYANEAGLWSVPLHGGSSTVLAPLLGPQLFGAAQITPDGARVVYVADQDTLGKPELYSVPIAGGPSVRISKDMAATGQVRDFALGQAQVYYAADAVSNNVIELWRVPQSGGTSVRVNRAMPNDNYDVFEYAVSAPPERVVFRVGRSTVGGHKLYSAPPTGTSAQSVEISRDMVTGGGVDEDFKISEDGSRVVYRCDCEDNGEFNLYSVAIAGGTSIRLNTVLGGVGSFRTTVAGGSEAVTYEQTQLGIASWFSVLVTGGTPVPVPPPVPEPLRSPDGKWIVYGAGVGLWSSHTSGNHQLVSCAGQTVTSTFIGKPTYSVSPDSRTVLYVAGALWSGPVSGSVCELFRNGFESGTAGAWIVVE